MTKKERSVLDLARKYSKLVDEAEDVIWAYREKRVMQEAATTKCNEREHAKDLLLTASVMLGWS